MATMPNRSEETSMRSRLLEAAARLLAEEGPSALSTRKVAAAANTSTMSVYTQFGSMSELVRGIVDEGFARLSERLSAVAHTDDPVSDLGGIARAYIENARANPHLYAVMYGTASLGGHKRSGDELSRGREVFDRHMDVVIRAMNAGRIREDNPMTVAQELWAATHGYVMLELAGFFGDGAAGIERYFTPLLTNLIIGLGNDPDATRASAKTWFA